MATTTTAYYTLDDSTDPARQEVTVTTEHPLSSYGQPVVIEGDKATPAQNFGRRLFGYFDRGEDGPERDARAALIVKANRLSGHYSPGADDSFAEATSWFER